MILNDIDILLLQCTLSATQLLGEDGGGIARTKGVLARVVLLIVRHGTVATDDGCVIINVTLMKTWWSVAGDVGPGELISPRSRVYSAMLRTPVPLDRITLSATTRTTETNSRTQRSHARSCHTTHRSTTMCLARAILDGRRGGSTKAVVGEEREREKQIVVCVCSRLTPARVCPSSSVFLRTVQRELE